MVFVFGYPAGESEEPIFSGRVAGTVSDTLQFPIREIRNNEIRQTIPSSALFLRQPSNIKDTIIYDPLTKRYVVARSAESIITTALLWKPCRIC